jgi:hypothetical protein
VLVADQAPVLANPCHAPAQHVLCPNLVMPPASRLVVRRTAGGRRLLQMDNYLVNAGPGRVRFRGHRSARYEMDAVQLIDRRGAPPVRYVTGAKLTWKYVDGSRGNYWKFKNAARFELWRMNGRGERIRLARVGPKLDYCLRDLFRRRTGPTVPSGPRFGACSQNLAATVDVLGISIGWADGYPYSYPQNYVDISRLRGCFVIIQRADPYNRVVERNERDNTSHRTVHLPGTSTRGCPRYRGLGIP